MRRALRVIAAFVVVAASMFGVATLALSTAPAAAPIGTAVAQTNSTELVNETVSVTTDDQSIYVEAENSTGNLTVAVYSINATDGTETEVANVTLSNAQGANNTELYEYSGIDPENVSEYRVTVDGEAVELVTIGTVSKVQSGGGGFAFDPSGLDMTTIAIGGAVVVGGLLLLGRD